MAFAHVKYLNQIQRFFERNDPGNGEKGGANQVEVHTVVINVKNCPTCRDSGNDIFVPQIVMHFWAVSFYFMVVWIISVRTKNNRQVGYPETKITDFEMSGTRFGKFYHHGRLILETGTKRE